MKKCDKAPGPREGELRILWKPTRLAGFCFHGDNLRQSWHYSGCLSLQWKAHMEGIPRQCMAAGGLPHQLAVIGSRRRLFD